MPCGLTIYLVQVETKHPRLATDPGLVTCNILQWNLDHLLRLRACLDVVAAGVGVVEPLLAQWKQQNAPQVVVRLRVSSFWDINQRCIPRNPCWFG